MAGLGLLFSGLSKLLSRGNEVVTIAVRNESKRSGMDPNKYPDCKMLRDVRRRQCAKEHAPMRLRLISMKRNNILPIEIRELASKAMDDIPRQSALRQLVPRCAITSRPRGVVYRWRLSRIVFRDLADHNRLAGVQRAMW